METNLLPTYCIEGMPEPGASTMPAAAVETSTAVKATAMEASMKITGMKAATVEAAIVEAAIVIVVREAEPESSPYR
jgi:hypothetical protein